MTANCTRCSGLESTLAPTSSKTEMPPLALGNGAARATRSTDSSVPNKNLATVMTAPVFPALTRPSALASRTSRAATCTELSFFLRKACAG